MKLTPTAPLSTGPVLAEVARTVGALQAIAEQQRAVCVAIGGAQRVVEAIAEQHRGVGPAIVAAWHDELPGIVDAIANGGAPDGLPVVCTRRHARAARLALTARFLARRKAQRSTTVLETVWALYTAAIWAADEAAHEATNVARVLVCTRPEPVTTPVVRRDYTRQLPPGGAVVCRGLANPCASHAPPQVSTHRSHSMGCAPPT